MSHSHSTVRVTRTLDTPLGVASAAPAAAGILLLHSKDEAMKGVPAKEQEEYGQKRDDCWRCGRSRHQTYECFSFSRVKGTTLPPAP